MKSKGYLTGVALAAALLVVPQAAWAAGFANTAHSGTQTGMAGVATGNPDEPSSNFYNPASMAYDDQWNVYLGATTLIPTVDFTTPDGDASYQTESQEFFPPNFNASVPVTDRVSVGLGATFPWGLGIAWPDDWVGKETFRNQSLETFNLNPNVAVDIPGAEELSLAGGVQLVRSALSQEFAQVLPDENEVDVRLGGYGYGVGATFAAMLRPNEDITVGLNYRSAVPVSYDGAVHFSEDVEGTPFQHRMIDQDVETQITMPNTINAGVGYQLSDALWVGVDVNYMTWRQYDEIEIEFSQQSPEGGQGETEPPIIIEGDWTDAAAVRIGGQYEFIDGLVGRMGVAYDMTPIPDDTVGPSLPDNDRYVFAGGLGYTNSGVRADLGYQFVTLPTREVRNGSVDGDYQMSSHVLGLNVGYGF